MAAAYLHHLSQGRIEVRSAGSAPGDAVNPAAVAAMAEEGIDISANQPKVLTDEAVQDSDVVITMGCGDACPVYPGRIYLDWAIEVPPAHDLQAQRVMRDEIQHRVEDLWRSLSPSGSEHHQP
jgi:protein-tyrosine-phosphatase